MPGYGHAIGSGAGVGACTRARLGGALSARALGRRDEALAVTEEAVTVRRTLPTARPTPSA